MGLIIKNISVSLLPEDGSVKNAAIASKKCIEPFRSKKKQINIIINTGIYRDYNIVEPAMATFIQKELALNTDFSSTKGERTFSFDIINGSSGFIYAAFSLDSLCFNQKIKNALIIASDGNLEEKYNHFLNSGSAVLLSYSKGKNGFKDFFFKTSKERNNGVSVFFDCKKGEDSRLTKTIFDNKYREKLFNFSLETTKEYINNKNIDLNKTKIITSVTDSEFLTSFANKIGFLEGTVIDTYSYYGRLHSTSLSFGYYLALKEKKIKKGDQVLFIGFGAGLTCAYALYIV